METPAAVLVATDPARGLPELLSTLWSEGLALPELHIDPGWQERNRDQLDPDAVKEFRILLGGDFAPEQFLPYLPYLLERLRGYDGEELLRVSWPLAGRDDLPAGLAARLGEFPGIAAPAAPRVSLELGATYREPLQAELWEPLPGFPAGFRRARAPLVLNPIRGGKPACFRLDVEQATTDYLAFLLGQAAEHGQYAFFLCQPRLAAELDPFRV